MTQDIILPEDPRNTPEPVNLIGFITKDRKFFKDETAARQHQATHTICPECGVGLAKKHWSACDSCISKRRKENYLKLPYQEYNEEMNVCLADGDDYFFNAEDIEEYMESNNLSTVDLLICIPQYFQQVGEDYWEDVMPENRDELPKELSKALAELNNVIKDLGPASWIPGKIRTSYTIKP